MMPAVKHWPQKLTWDERRAAYERALPEIKKHITACRYIAWTRAEFVIHWRGILANQDAVPIARRMALEALANLAAETGEEA